MAQNVSTIFSAPSPSKFHLKISCRFGNIFSFLEKKWISWLTKSVFRLKNSLVVDVKKEVSIFTGTAARFRRKKVWFHRFDRLVQWTFYLRPWWKSDKISSSNFWQVRLPFSNTLITLISSAISVKWREEVEKKLDDIEIAQKSRSRRHPSSCWISNWLFLHSKFIFTVRKKNRLKLEERKS